MQYTKLLNAFCSVSNQGRYVSESNGERATNWVSCNDNYALCNHDKEDCCDNNNDNDACLAEELAENSNVQDAFVIAVEQQARERLEKLSALRKIKPVDMSALSQQARNIC